MSKKIIVVFPGQGSQIIGMGKDLFLNHHIAKQVFEEVDETLNFKLSKIIFEGPLEKLTHTPNTQPALMAVSMAIVKVLEFELKSKIFQLADIILGHSLGEYCALCSLGAISLKDTTLLLKIRGEAMQNAVKNLDTKMMAVIGMEINDVEMVINDNKLPNNEVCEIANDNCPGQVILSGTEKGLDFFSDLLKQKGARTLIELKVSAPFHCSLMKSASEIMQKKMNSIKLNELQARFISNVTADFEEDVEEIKRLLVRQIYSRVRWRESVIKSSQELNEIIEIGSGKVLTGMSKRINKSLKCQNISNLEEIEIFLNQY